jgi:hypothetical protein
MTTDVKTQQRKPYHAPVLHVYGGITTLTKSIDKQGNFDAKGIGGGGGNNRTK